MAKTIEDIQALKLSAEIELHDAVVRIYARFAMQSGIYPQSITVELTQVNITTIDSAKPEYARVVSAVSLDITI